ncbi:MAG: sigma-70 family RNA polymerase sigma factor [Anaerolineae bacterium]|nr:sigma-70 family RNA polymerase sigma factor [Anaerolineae bacterium]
MNADPLAEAVERARLGDQTAFARLVDATQSHVFGMALSVMGDWQRAEDATQEIYLRVWRALPSFRGESSFRTWLYRISLNTCLNQRRALRGQLRIVDDDVALDRLSDREGDPASVVVERERDAILWARVGSLPEKYRLVIVLFYQQQLSYAEIANLLSLPLGTVKAHLNRARKALAQCLQPHLQPEMKDALL